MTNLEIFKNLTIEEKKEIKEYITEKYRWIKYDLEKMDIDFYSEILEHLLDNNLLKWQN